MKINVFCISIMLYKVFQVAVNFEKPSFPKKKYSFAVPSSVNDAKLKKITDKNCFNDFEKTQKRRFCIISSPSNDEIVSTTRFVQACLVLSSHLS